jgi:DegV family protein with EDD domain
MKIALSTESTVDLPQELLKKLNIFCIPFNVILGDEEKKDDSTLTADMLYDFVAKTNILPKTAAISEFEYEEYFQSILNQGYDKVLHFSLSSDLSSSCQNAQKTAEKLKNVVIIDTKSLSTGIALLVLSAHDKLQSGMEFDKVVEQINQEVPRVQASFVINNLRYLHKGGRCSSLALLGANLLKIKPQIVLKDGKMCVGKKYRGKDEEVLATYTKDVLSENNPDKSRVFVTSSSKVDFEQKMVEALQQQGFEQIITTQAGATICSHCGPQTIGILFINKA